MLSDKKPLLLGQPRAPHALASQRRPAPESDPRYRKDTAETSQGSPRGLRKRPAEGADTLGAGTATTMPRWHSARRLANSEPTAAPPSHTCWPSESVTLQALLYSKRLSAQSRRVQHTRRFDPRASPKAMRAISCAVFAALAVSMALAAPTASSFAPSNGATNVHPLSSVAVTFGADVEAQAAKLVELRRAGTGQVLSTVAALSSFVKVTGPTASISFPLAHVPAGSVYVTIEAGAFVSKADQTPFAGIAGSTWSFEFQGERRQRRAAGVALGSAAARSAPPLSRGSQAVALGGHALPGTRRSGSGGCCRSRSEAGLPRKLEVATKSCQAGSQTTELRDSVARRRAHRDLAPPSRPMVRPGCATEAAPARLWAWAGGGNALAAGLCSGAMSDAPAA